MKMHDGGWGTINGFNPLDIPGGKADRWSPQSRKSKYEIPTFEEVKRVNTNGAMIRTAIRSRIGL
jgi:hypothetical protein